MQWGGAVMIDLSRMPIESTDPPSAVKSQPNGAVDEALLDLVDDRKTTTFKMATFPARGMIAMHAAIKRDLGVTLSSTGRGRSLADQWKIFGGDQKRYQPCSEADFNRLTALKKGLTKRFPAADRLKVAERLGIEIPEEEFWTKIPNANGKGFPAMAAVPGKSPHGLWCADDLALSGGRNLTEQVVNWLFDNEGAFGFAHSTTTETWHVQWVVGDHIPQAVLAFEEENPFAGNGLHTLGSDERLENDMAKTIKLADNDAIFSTDGLMLSWISQPDEYAAAVRAGLAEPIDNVETVDPSTLKALLLVGPLPPNFNETHFKGVIDEHSSAPPA
jgi:hypothetical protein